MNCWVRPCKSRFQLSRMNGCCTRTIHSGLLFSHSVFFVNWHLELTLCNDGLRDYVARSAFAAGNCLHKRDNSFIIQIMVQHSYMFRMHTNSLKKDGGRNNERGPWIPRSSYISANHKADGLTDGHQKYTDKTGLLLALKSPSCLLSNCGLVFVVLAGLGELEQWVVLRLSGPRAQVR